LSIWLALIKGSDETPSPIILYAPVLSIVLLGVYAVGSIVVGLMRIKDTPEASTEIERQIVEATAEMKKRGVLKDR